MIEENVKKLLQELSSGNPFGETVTLVAATKTRTAEEINRAIEAGIRDIGENRVQEFTRKYDEIVGANRHFIGRLQTNKVKYLIKKTALIHSVDRDDLSNEIALRSRQANAVTDILLEVNLGEASKGGYPLEEAYRAYERTAQTEGIRVCGFMAMLPQTEEVRTLELLAHKMRALYERAREKNSDVRYLSMGMSGDWKLCVSCGANMIRLGTAIFRERRT